MKSNRRGWSRPVVWAGGCWMLLGALTAPSPGATTATSANEIMATHFYDPEMIQRYAGMLKLTDNQLQYLQAEFGRIMNQVTDLQARLRQQTDRLLPIVQQPVVEEERLIEQSQQILQLEREIKTAQLRLLVRANNILTPSQKEQLNQIRQQVQALRAKWANVQKLMFERQLEGANLAAFEPLRDEYETAMQEGAIPRADAALDRALRQLQAMKPE